MVKLKKGLLVITLVSLIMLSIRPFNIYASTTGNEVSFTNDTSYNGYLKLYRTEVQPVSGYSGGNYTYAYYIATDPGLYGQIQGYCNNNNTDIFSVAIIDGISEFFYSNQINVHFTYINLSTDSSVIPQELLDNVQSIDDRLSIIEKIKQWNVPYESFSFIASVMSKNVELLDMLNYGYFNFPIYHGYQNQEFCQFWLSSSYTYKFVGITSKQVNNVNNFNANFITDNPNLTVFHYQQLSSPFTFLNTNELGYVFSVEIKTSSNKTTRFKFNSEMYFVPIYFERLDNKNISTDFALVFGLSNQLLDDLHIVANGTQASSDSSSSLESSTSSFSSTASDVYNVEDQVSSGFSSSMQNIPSSFNFLNNFGSSFVVSASWVRDQFNNMTANNPFGSLITFSLILGVALLIIGRLLS